MKNMRRTAGFLLALVMAGLCACGPRQEPETEKSFALGEEVSNYWFDFTVTKVETADHWNNRRAEEGKRLVLCTLEMESDTEESVPMGWDDFLLCWGGEDATEEKTAALPWQSPEQIPDEFMLHKDEQVEGLLIYQIPLEVERAALVFQERFNEGESDSRYEEGERFLVWLDLEPAEEKGS